MITREVLVLTHEEEAIYYTQQAIASTEAMMKLWKMHKITRHGAIPKMDAKGIAHQGFQALMHNSVALSLPVEELLERANSTGMIRKYSWQK